VKQVLGGLTARDAEDMYAAIRLAQPGGLGTTAEMDVAGSAPQDLLEAMRAAADRDMVARQYAEGFAHVLRSVAPWIAEGCAAGWSLTEAVIHTQLRLLAAYPTV